MEKQQAPRRVIITEMWPVELALHNAMVEIEKMPADVEMTLAGALVQQALDKVSNFIDKR